MKVQSNSLSCKVVIGISFFATLLIMAACKGRKETVPDDAASQTEVIPPPFYYIPGAYYNFK